MSALALLVLAPPLQAQDGAAGADTATRPGDFIVAIVNQEPVTNNEVQARLAQVQHEMERASAVAPPAQSLRQQVLERLISERAELQYARSEGLDVTEEALVQAELSIARQNDLTSVAELHQRLAEEGIVLEDFRADLRNQVLLSRLRAVEIEPNISVSAAEVERYIREQTGAPEAMQEINLAMILVAVPERGTAADKERLRQRAEDIARQARGGADFAGLAREHSDAFQRGDDGGELGLRPVSEYPELFVQSTRTARVGTIVGPVESAAGFHVLKVLDRKVSHELPEVRIPHTRVRHILLKVGPEQGQRLAIDRAADFKRRIESGRASFAELALQHSADDSAQAAGDLGWVAPGQLVPEFEQAMNNLDPGQISDPVVTRFGVHLIAVDDRQDRILTDEEQRELARNMLREQKAAEAFETWAREVRGRAYVEYREPPL